MALVGDRERLLVGSRAGIKNRVCLRCNGALTKVNTVLDARGRCMPMHIRHDRSHYGYTKKRVKGNRPYRVQKASENHTTSIDQEWLSVRPSRANNSGGVRSKELSRRT